MPAPLPTRLHAARRLQVTLLISSSSSAVVFAITGAVPWDYGAVLMVIGFLGTAAGQIVIAWVVHGLGLSSILVIVLALMFTAAVGASGAVVVLALIELARDPSLLGAHDAVCS